MGDKCGQAAHILVALILMLEATLAGDSEPQRKTIVILGDSIAAGHGVQPDEAFPALLQEKLDKKKLPYEVVNAGVSGDTTAGGARRMPWLLRRKMDVLVLELGGNDGLRGITPKETKANLEKIVYLARQKNPQVQIIVAGMQMPQNMGEEYTREFRQVFPAVAKEKKTKLIPFLLEGVGGKADLNLPDRIHPNPEGHRIIAETVWAAIEPVLMERVKLLRTPNGGVQPQAAVDDKGTVHLVYLGGDAKASDVFYVRRAQDAQTFSKPIRVNSTPGSAIAVGTIRGAQLALGRNSHVHVAWNGSGRAQSHPGAPMLYARLNDAGTAFEPQRDVMTRTMHLDGGGSVAADNAGNVYVIWHAAEVGGEEGEENRAVFIARSSDDGKTFSREERASAAPPGVCGCCGLRAFTDSAGDVFVLYRAAVGGGTERGERLLLSRNRGKDFEIAYQHAWKLTTCPMSSAFLSESKGGILAAAETHNRVFFVRFDPKTGKASEPISPAVKAKHPVAVGNDRGEVLLVWTEGTGWEKGGAVAWQVFGANGQPTEEKGRRDGIPVWSFASAVARPDGTFEILY